MDERLKGKYDRITTREDFVKFFFWFDSMASLNNDGDYVSFYIHKERLKKDFNLKSLHGKRIWKLEELLKKSIESGIIGQTGYSNFHGKNYTRKYYYMVEFINEIMSSEIEVILEDVNYKDYDENLNKKMPTDPGPKAQLDLLMSDRFHIDFGKGCQTLLDFYNDEVKNNMLLKEQATKRLKIQITRLMHLCDKKIFANTDERTGRVFSSFSTIKKEIRDLCTIDGRPLIEIDLKSSQPFIWLKQLIKENPDNKNLEKLYDILKYKDIYIHFKELFVWLNGSPEYEEWDSKTNRMVKKSINNRDDAKTEFMRYLFKAPQGEVPFQKVCKVFYPDIYKLTQDLKKRSGNLAVLLQKIEADIFIPVQNELVEKGSLSVHDSLYVKTELDKEAKEKLKNQMNIIFN